MGIKAVGQKRNGKVAVELLQFTLSLYHLIAFLL